MMIAREMGVLPEKEWLARKEHYRELKAEGKR